MRFSLAATPSSKPISVVGQFSHLAVQIGQSENFEHLANQLKAGLEKMHLEGCFLVSCFGFNRETRFGHWTSRYVFPLRSDLTEIKPTLTFRDDLIIISSGFFTLVVGSAAELTDKDDSIADLLLMLGESARLWVKGYTNQVDQEFDSLNHRKASCKQLLEVVHQLDESGRDITSTHKRVVSAINSGVPEGIALLHLTDTQQSIVLDEFDEIGRAYSIFTKQQMELHRQLKEQVRSVAEFLLARENNV